MLAGNTWPEGVTEAELVSFHATVINRIAYASLEEARIDSLDPPRHASECDALVSATLPSFGLTGSRSALSQHERDGGRMGDTGVGVARERRARA